MEGIGGEVGERAIRKITAALLRNLLGMLRIKGRRYQTGERYEAGTGIWEPPVKQIKLQEYTESSPQVF